MGKKIRVNGIKLSQELIHINLLTQPEEEHLVNRLMRSMAENRINCPIVQYSAMDRRVQGACCIDMEDSPRLNHVLSQDPDLANALELISPVGALSLFPHQFSLKILGCLMHVIGKADLPMYGMAASLSALTFTTDFALLEKAIKLLRPHLSLPRNHAPFRPQLRIRTV